MSISPWLLFALPASAVAGALLAMAVARRRRARGGAQDRPGKSEAQYRAIFDSADAAMAVIDAKGIIQSVNPSVARMFGHKPAALIGRSIAMLVPESIGAHLDALLAHEAQTGETAIAATGREASGRRKDGSVFPIDLSVAEWRYDGDIYFTWAMRDISARKQAESALRDEARLRLLQYEFAHVSRVNDLGGITEAIAHEINQPLTAIVNYLNTALQRARGADSAEAFGESAKLIGDAAAQALRAGEIVRQLRGLVGHGNAPRTVEKVEPMVDAAIAIALIDARSGGIAVERVAGAEGAEVDVDAVQIQQVLVNLLNNAVEAMNRAPLEAGLARIRIGTAVTRDGMIELTVADNGPDIAPAIAERIFDPFVTTKKKGMGMGLPVCRRLVQAHGGTIEAESAPGGGALFRVRLPRFRPASDWQQ